MNNQCGYETCAACHRFRAVVVVTEHQCALCAECLEQMLNTIYDFDNDAGEQ